MTHTLNPSLSAQTQQGSAISPKKADDGSATYLSLAEQTMIQQAQAGNHQALRQFYETYHSQIRGHLYRLLGSDHEVDDLVQTIFVRAFSGLHTFKGNSSIRTWLYRIATNTTHNLLRQRFRRNRVCTAFKWFSLSITGHIEHKAIHPQAEAKRLLQLLAPDLQTVFVLYHYEGLTLQEIADILDKPVSTVGDRLIRARKRLHKLVSHESQ